MNVHSRKTIPIKTPSNQNINIFVDKYPDECPICHVHVHPAFYCAVPTLEFPKGNVELAFQCNSDKCQKLFIGTYIHDTSITSGQQFSYRFSSATPQVPKPASFNETVIEISPQFTEIYNQCINAESSNLHQLAGIGYRKALEYLIKDYTILINPDKAEDIKNLFLGNCIKDYVDDPNIKACAERAVWLGNDEAHYVRKWEDRDIKDLKLLIQLTQNWIENVVLTKKYIDEMNFDK